MLGWKSFKNNRLCTRYEKNKKALFLSRPFRNEDTFIDFWWKQLSTVNAAINIKSHLQNITKSKDTLNYPRQ